MPPKKAGASKKTEAKKKERLIEDKTFGLKNKKGGKQQKFIEQVEKQVKTGGPSWAQNQEKKKALERKKAKEAELAELEKLFGKALPAKKGGSTMIGKKGKVDPKEKSKKADLYTDKRDEENDKTMENWTEDDLRAAIEKKHGKSNTNAATTTDKICNIFLQAVEDNKYGWFWECPNGDKCKYRHCLPEGYVLKRDLKKMKDAENENKISIEDLIERERAALGTNLTKVTWETFSIWKKKKREEKKKTLAKENKKKKGKAKTGQTSGLTGRELFTFNANMGGDDEEAEDIEFEKEEIDPEEKIHEIGANTFDIGASEVLLRSKGAVPTSAEFRYDWGGESATNQPIVISTGTGATTTAETTTREKPAEPAAPAVEVDEDLFGEDLGDIDAELGDLGLEEGAS